MGSDAIGTRRRGVRAGAVAGRAAGLAMLVLMVGAWEASAQHVRGQLRDVATGVPIAAGTLTLLSADSTVIGRTLSGADGSWRLDVPVAGMYRIAAERLGYETWVSEAFEVGPGDELDSVFRLKASPIALTAIEVEAEAVRLYLDYAGFFERQRSNFGHFITPADIERRQADRVTDLLTTIPGVHRVTDGGGGAGPAQIQLRGSSLSQGGYCRPRVFVDGLMYSRGDGRPVRLREGDATEREEALQQRMDQSLSLDDIGHPSTIAAIEVYRSASQVPVQFGGTSVETLCGVIVVWTNTGRRRGSER